MVQLILVYRTLHHARKRALCLLTYKSVTIVEHPVKQAGSVHISVVHQHEDWSPERQGIAFEEIVKLHLLLVVTEHQLVSRRDVHFEQRNFLFLDSWGLPGEGAAQSILGRWLVEFVSGPG